MTLLSQRLNHPPPPHSNKRVKPRKQSGRSEECRLRSLRY
jgi:hypothetical protein